MKAPIFFRSTIYAILFFCVAVNSVTSQTPQEATECAQEMVAHYIGNVAPANVGCALNLATQLRRLHSNPSDISIRDEVASTFTSCYPAMPNSNVLVNKLIDKLDEVNDVNATIFGGSTCLSGMWGHIDSVLAQANAQAQADAALRGMEGNGNGSSTGEPHITTLDGFRYDFQAEGIFTAFVNYSGDFEVQLIQRKVGSQVSQNEAVAIKYGTANINFAVGIKTPIVNGKTFTEKFPANLPSGVMLSQSAPNLFLIQTPKGDSILVKLTKRLLDIHVQLSPSSIGAIKGGILGNFDFNKNNEFTARTGRKIKTADIKKRDILYGIFGNSWRIETAKSLFVDEIKAKYPSFDAEFPNKTHGIDEVSKKEADLATKLCIKKGITEAQSLKDCVYDLAVTNDPEFADSAEFSQQVKKNPLQFFKKTTTQSTGFRGTYTIDYSFSDGSKQSSKEVEVAVGNDKSALRYRLKNGVSSRFLINHSEKTYLNITQFDNKTIPSIATKQPFSQEMLRTESVQTTRTEQTKTILGYNCRKYIYQGRSSSAELWVAESLKQTQIIPIEYLLGLVDRGFVFLATFPKFLSMNDAGMVLEANLKQQNNNVTFRVKSINPNIDESFFDLSGVKIMGR